MFARLDGACRKRCWVWLNEGGGWGPPPPLEGGGGPPPPTAPQTVEHPSGSHIGWRQPPWPIAVVYSAIVFHTQPFYTPSPCLADIKWHALFWVVSLERIFVAQIWPVVAIGLVGLAVGLVGLSRSRATFFLYMDPLTHGGGSGIERQVPRVAPPYGPLLVRTQPFSRRIRLFSYTCKISKNSTFPKPLCRPWDGFG